MATYSASRTIVDPNYGNLTCTVTGTYTITLAEDFATVTFGNINVTWHHPTSDINISVRCLLYDNPVIWSGLATAGDAVAYAPTVTSDSMPRSSSDATGYILVTIAGQTVQAAAFTIPGLGPYTVTYYDNGGSGSPSPQTKTHGVPLTLSSIVPTRQDYIFDGWGTSPSQTSATYHPGGTYSANASVDLYALWHRAYYPPQIQAMSAYRCDSSGVAQDEGTYAAVELSWTLDVLVEEPSASVSNTGTISATVNGVTRTVSTGQSASGSSKIVLPGSLSETSSYDVVATIQDTYGGADRAATKTVTIPTAFITMDVRRGGHGISFGAPAVDDSHNIAMPPKVYGREDLPVYKYDALPAESSLPLKPCIVVLTTGEVYLAT